jgi:predicted dehydrogenase
MAHHLIDSCLRPIKTAVTGAVAAYRDVGASLPAVKELQLVGLVDPAMSTAKSWARQVGRPVVRASLVELLADVDAGAVLIWSDEGSRSDELLLALDQGLHALVRGPLPLDLPDLREVVSLARHRRVVVMPACLRAADPALLAAARACRSGIVGRATHLRAEWMVPLNDDEPCGTRWRDLLAEFVLCSVRLCSAALGPAVSLNADMDDAQPAGSAPRIANIVVQHNLGYAVLHLSHQRRAAPVEQYLIHGDEGVLQCVAAEGRGAALPHGRIALARAGSSAPAVPVGGDLSRQNAAEALLSAYACAVRGEPSPLPDMEAMLAAYEFVEAAAVSSRERVRMPAPHSVPLTASPDAPL